MKLNLSNKFAIGLRGHRKHTTNPIIIIIIRTTIYIAPLKREYF